ncbi:MAG: cobyrinate a,c-diamide synthase [Lautropia sp.]|nr:cobyrinate a,c-diamide synthase [Lautropia sp.]
MSFRVTPSEAGLAAAVSARAGASQNSLLSRCVPGVLISAPASGHGKTTVVAAFARLLTRRGLRVRVFKYGPDFLDPVWHGLATGQPVHNIDLWMTGEDYIRQCFHDAAAEADLVIVEGVMGLYDGTPSAAELALRFDLPVMAVIDAGRMAGTFGALAHGLRSWMPGLRWAGVLANRVASTRHAQLLADSLRPSWRADGDEPAAWASAGWLGAVFRNESFGLPSRHLGLIAGTELPDAMARLDAAADALLDTALAHLDADGLNAWMTRFDPPLADARSRSDPSLSAAGPDTSFRVPRLAGGGCVTDEGAPDDRVSEPSAPIPSLAGHTIAVARDAAFSFVYQANLDTLQALGARLRFFSPLAGDDLPDCDALWLPGGYPELYAEKLAANTVLAQQIAAHVAADRAVWAECGGMLPLFESLEFEGTRWPMWGVLPGSAQFQTRLAGLGMQQLVWPVQRGSAAFEECGAGHRVLRGHTFHYSRIDTPLVPVARSSRPNEAVTADKGEAVYRYRRLHASYFHAWFASAPAVVSALFAGAEAAASKRSGGPTAGEGLDPARARRVMLETTAACNSVPDMSRVPDPDHPDVQEAR